MSQHDKNITQRFRTSTERSPFRTVAGSYEAPVEGIVDYGAFSRGFESTFTLPEEEEEIKLPGKFEDIDFSGSLSKTTNLGFNEVATQSYNKSLNTEIQKLQDEYDLAVVRNGQDSRQAQDVMAKYKHLKKVVGSSELAVKQMVDNEGAFDMQQAKINTTTRGVGSSQYDTSPFIDLVNTKKQTQDSNYSIFIDYENQTGGISANGYMYDTSGLNANNVGSLTPIKSGIDSKATEFAKEFKIDLQPVTSVTGGTGQSREIKTTTSFTSESVNALDQGARIFAEQNYDINKQPEDFQATFLDAVFGIHRRRGSATQEQINNKEFVSFVDSFGEEGYKLNPEDEKGYTFKDFKEHIESEAFYPGSGNIPTNVINGLTREAVRNRFLINVGSKLYAANEYNQAIRREDLVSTKQRTPDEIETPKGPFTRSDVDKASRILAQINYNQSGAEDATLNYFSGIEIGEEGTIINPRIIREGNKKFLVYDTRTGSGGVSRYGKEEDERFPEQRFDLTDSEDRIRLARLKAQTLYGKDAGVDKIAAALPEASRERTSTQNIFGFFSRQNRTTGITGVSRYNNAVQNPKFADWWKNNEASYNRLDLLLTEKAKTKRANKIINDFNKFINK